MTNRGKQTPISPCHVKGVALDTAISDRSPVEYGPNLNTMRAQMQREGIFSLRTITFS